MSRLGKLLALPNAWLRCGEQILTGRRGMVAFIVIATFAEDGK